MINRCESSDIFHIHEAPPRTIAQIYSERWTGETHYYPVPKKVSVPMNIETFCICDHAEDNQGKLSVFGIFDTLNLNSTPAIHPHCCLALRVRFQQSEEGEHTVRIALVNVDGHGNGIRVDGKLEMKIPANVESGASNLVMALNNMPLPAAGTYYWDLVIDGQLVSRLPMFVKSTGEQRKAA